MEGRNYLGMPNSEGLPEQLDIMITTQCQAACSFCIQEATFQPSSVSSQIFMDAVGNHVQEFVRRGGTKIVITGGEPLLKPQKVLDVLSVLSKFPELKMIALYTNGECLIRAFPGAERSIVEVLAKSCLTDVNVSVHHFDDSINNHILKRESKVSTKVLAKALRSSGLRFRFNCVIQKAGIDNLQEVIDFVHFAFRLGAGSIYFRQLFGLSFSQPVSDGRYNPIGFIQQELVEVLPIVEQLEASGKFKYQNCRNEQFREKYEWHFVHTSTGKDVYFSRLVVGTEKQEGVPYLVVMPDGKLYRGWLGSRDEFTFE